MGCSVAVVPESTVWHVGGGTLPNDSPFKLELNYRNNLLLLDNNLPSTVGRTRARLIICVRYILDLASAVVYLLGGHPERCKAVFKAHKAYRSLRAGRTLPSALRLKSRDIGKFALSCRAFSGEAEYSNT